MSLIGVRSSLLYHAGRSPPFPGEWYCEAVKHLSVMANAGRPRPFALDEPTRVIPHVLACLLCAKHSVDRRRQRARVSGFEKKSRLAVLDQLTVPSYVGRDEYSALRHRLERLEGGHELGQAHAMARIHEQIHK